MIKTTFIHYSLLLSFMSQINAFARNAMSVSSKRAHLSYFCTIDLIFLTFVPVHVQVVNDSFCVTFEQVKI